MFAWRPGGMPVSYEDTKWTTLVTNHFFYAIITELKYESFDEVLMLMGAKPYDYD